MTDGRWKLVDGEANELLNPGRYIGVETLFGVWRQRSKLKKPRAFRGALILHLRLSAFISGSKGACWAEEMGSVV
jgi:hypothetical protein